MQNCILLQIPNTSVNGGIHAEPKVGNRDRERNRIGSGESERESLLIHENTPKYIRQKTIHICTDQGGEYFIGRCIFMNLNLKIFFGKVFRLYCLFSPPSKIFFASVKS